MNVSEEFVKKFTEFFRAKGINDNGICGMLGNIYAESGCQSNNLQNSYNKMLGMTDEEFTKAVDEGRFDFTDSSLRFGYGLCQWTSIGRRRGLYDTVKSMNVSIADLTAQMTWLYTELSNSYKTVLAELKNPNNTIRSCAEVFVVKFEVPASVIAGGISKESTIKARTEYAEEFKEKFFKEDKGMKKILCISAGHYLGQPGKRCDKRFDPNETREWTLNSRIADMVEMLLEDYEGIEIHRLDDTKGDFFVTLANRSKLSDSYNADFYLAIHHNAGINGGKGGGVVCYCKKGKKVNAEKLYNSVVSRNGLRGNRSKPINDSNDLWEVNHPKAESILIENGFMDSSVDTPQILTPAYALASAEGIARFFIDLWGLKKKSEPVYPTNVFKVRVTTAVLNIRQKPTTLSAKTGKITDKGIYTIIDVSGDWGKLKSGLGWIHLGYTQRL